MKLRIRGNSIRLRLTESEVEGLAAGKRITETTQLGGGGRLNYTVEVREDQPEPATRFIAGPQGTPRGEIHVLLPAARVRTWATGEEEGIYGKQDVEGGEQLTVAVEKDFRCLTPRSEGEDPPDAYPHPKEGEIRC